MRNFLAFIRRFRVLLFFGLLQGIALSIYFSFVAFPRSQYMTTASTVSGTLMEYRNELTKHFNLSKNNSWLQEENIKLRSKLPMSYMPIEKGLVKINDTLNEVQYEYIPATVVNSTYDKRNNYFTINVGKIQGIEVEQGVFSDQGLVGIIHNVGTHYSVVKSCLTKDLNTDVMISPSGEQGFLKWDGKDARYGSVVGVSNDLSVKLGSNVVTRGSAGIFPRGIKVGTIIKTEPVEGQPLWDITIRFAVDFRKIQRVYVIKNLLKHEQKELEAQIPKDEE